MFKCAKAAKYVKTASKVISNAATFGVAAAGGTKSIKNIYKNVKQGNVLTKENFAELANIGLSAFTMICSGKNMIASGKELGGMLKEDVPKAWSSVKNSKSRGVLSDYLGVPESNSNGLFYSIKNQNGGDVYVSRDVISASNFEDIVADANGKAKVNIISGIHGDDMGGVKKDIKLYLFDAKFFESANVFNYAELNAKQLCDIINSPDITICAWCFSEKNPIVRMALTLGKQ